MTEKGSHYEALGVDARATPEQIEKAYRFCMEMYGEGALATYSLLAPAEARAEREDVQRAYEVLRDPAKRHEYDVGLGLRSGNTPLLPFPSPVPAAEKVGAPAPASPRLAARRLAGPVRGAELRRLREESGISLRTIASASKIGVRFFEYIEGDRYDRLPAPVYLRGFLQEYARALGLDPHHTAEAYLATLPKQG